MTPVRPRLSAIVCTAGRPQLLGESLACLAACLREGDELVVAEAGGDFASQVLDRLRPSSAADLRHLRVEPPGKCRQLNAAIRASAGDVLLLTDDDVRVPPGWADAMAAPFAEREVGLACGKVRGLSRVPGAAEDPGPPPGPAPFEPWRFAHGASMAVRRKAAEEAGGFDERLGPGTPACGEDHDFVLRVRERGWRVVIPPGEPAEHVEWRDASANRRNALAYERGGGAVVGAAIRRSARQGLPILRARLAYQRAVFGWNRGFGTPALAAFGSGFAYGLTLDRRDWIRTS